MPLLTSILAIFAFSAETRGEITVTANVEEAAVAINGRVVGKTPLTIKTDGSGFHFLVTKEGYENYVVKMNSKLDPRFFGNQIMGEFLGSVTNTSRGDAYLINDHIHVQLVGKGRFRNETGRMARDVEFSLITFKYLVKNIKLGKGPYLESLCKIKKIDDAKKQRKFLKYLRTSLKKTGRPWTFAKLVGNY